MITAHADVVGLLRPPELLEARRRFEEGEISIPEFKRAEDRPWTRRSRSRSAPASL